MQQEARKHETQALTKFGKGQMQRKEPAKFSLILNPAMVDRPRTRSSFTICHLSPELLTQIFRGFHVRDLLSLKQVCLLFHDVIDNNPRLWAQANFFNSWPLTGGNLSIFNKASNFGNFEACVKLAIAKLYNEGLSEEDMKIPIEEKARQATEHFFQAEQHKSAEPFTWIFIRPPWASSALNCKASVFEALKLKQLSQKVSKKHCKSTAAAALCVGKILELLDNEQEANTYYEKASQHGSVEGLLKLWKNNYGHFLEGKASGSKTMDPGRELEAVRELRSVVIRHSNSPEAKMLLSEFYVRGKFGGFSYREAYTFTREVFQSSAPVNYLPALCPPYELKASMRYILVDWMAEVATMKNFTSIALHTSVDIVNRCLLLRCFKRHHAQLLGISAMIICSRYWATDILTIKEAAWLTDGTYTYSDVVKMMGEIMAVLEGNIRFLTVCDFISVLKKASGLSERGQYLVSYISELCLLQACLAKYSPAKIAASCILLARILIESEVIWPDMLETVTGFCIRDLTDCCFDIHEKCFMEGIQFDHRDYPMQAVIQRHKVNGDPFSITQMQVLSQSDLKDKLGVVDPVVPKVEPRLKLRGAFICSPSRGKARSRRPSERMVERPSRDEASTPSQDHDTLGGYEADFEDDADLDESFCSIRSEEDSEYDPRTESFSEPSSEPDPLYLRNPCSNAYISFSSPFAPFIRLANCLCQSCSSTSSLSTSSSSGVASAARSHSVENSPSTSATYPSTSAIIPSTSASFQSNISSSSHCVGTPSSHPNHSSSFSYSSSAVAPHFLASSLPLQSLGFPSAQFYGHQSSQAAQSTLEVHDCSVEDENADNVSQGFSAADDLLSDDDELGDREEVFEDSTLGKGMVSVDDEYTADSEGKLAEKTDTLPSDSKTLFGYKVSTISPVLGSNTSGLKGQRADHNLGGQELVYTPEAYMLQYGRHNTKGRTEVVYKHVCPYITKVVDKGRLLNISTECQSAYENSKIVYNLLTGEPVGLVEYRDRAVGTSDDVGECYSARIGAQFDNTHFGYLLHYAYNSKNGDMLNINIPVSDESVILEKCKHVLVPIPDSTDSFLIHLEDFSARSLSMAQLVDSCVGTSDEINVLHEGCERAEARSAAGKEVLVFRDDSVTEERVVVPGTIGDSFQCYGQDVTSSIPRFFVFPKDECATDEELVRISCGAGFQASIGLPVAQSSPCPAGVKSSSASGGGDIVPTRRQGLRSQSQAHMSLKFLDAEPQNLGQDMKSTSLEKGNTVRPVKRKSGSPATQSDSQKLGKEEVGCNCQESAEKGSPKKRNEGLPLNLSSPQIKRHRHSSRSDKS